MDPKLGELTKNKLKLTRNSSTVDCIRPCRIMVEKVLVRSEKLFELSYIWFSAKPMLVG
jgi:hypothetical protein